MCLYPEIILNPKYKRNKKNGGIVPPLLDERVKYVPIGCQQCIECRKQQSRQWQIRLSEHIKHTHNGKFITLTLSNEYYRKIYLHIKRLASQKGRPTPDGYALEHSIITYAERHFMERWRRSYKKTLQHWLVSELGHNGTENIHLHGIVFTDHAFEIIAERWKYGYMYPNETTNRRTNYVSERTINYIVKYITKPDEKHYNYKPIILASPGIGNQYTNGMCSDYLKNKYKPGKTIETYRTRTGIKLNMPIYYRNKIYSEEEREKLWIEKLNKQERWVLGNKIDITRGYEEYDAAVKAAREDNKNLGYGSSEKDWTQEHYEKQRRALLRETRIRNA